MFEIPAGGSRTYSVPDDVPESATLRVAGEGRQTDFAQANSEVEVATAGLPVGEYRCYWAWQAESGVQHLLRTEGFRLTPVEGPDQDERILKAAKDALEASAGSDSLSINVEGFSTGTMSRLEFLAFVNRLERKVRNNRRRAELGITKRGKYYIRSGNVPTGIWG